MIGLALARFMAAALCTVGAGAILAPRTSARIYGFTTTDPAALAFVRAAGARDVALGLLIAVTSRLERREAVTAAVGAGVIVAAADVVIAAGGKPRARSSLGVHASGAVALGVTHALLHLGR